jgi:hypothetical protein
MTSFVVPKDSPKYVKGIISILHPKVPAKIKVISSGTLIGTMKDLLKFTFRPIELAKVWSNPLRKNSCLASAGMMISMSSSYWTIGYG